MGTGGEGGHLATNYCGSFYVCSLLDCFSTAQFMRIRQIQLVMGAQVRHMSPLIVKNVRGCYYSRTSVYRPLLGPQGVQLIATEKFFPMGNSMIFMAMYKFLGVRF